MIEGTWRTTPETGARRSRIRRSGASSSDYSLNYEIFAATGVPLTESVIADQASIGLISEGQCVHGASICLQEPENPQPRHYWADVRGWKEEVFGRPRHRGGSNFVFMDGHLHWYRAVDAPPDFAGRTGLGLGHGWGFYHVLASEQLCTPGQN